MTDKIRLILVPAIGALVGWVLLEPWNDNYGYFRDLMLFYSLGLGIVLAILCEQGIYYRKPKLFMPYLKNYKVYLIPFIGALLIKVMFTKFSKEEVKCNQDEITDQIVLILDCSGSMAGNPIKELKLSVNEYLELLKCSKSNDRIAVVTFNDNANILSSPTTNYDALSSEIRNLSTAGGTNMSSGLELAFDMVSKFDKQKVSFILVSDGMPADKENVYNLVASNTFVSINTIGVGAGYSEDLLKEIATKSRGNFYAANDIASLTNIFKEIAIKQGGGITQINTNSTDKIKLNYKKRILGWTLLGLFIGLTIGWVDKRRGIRNIALIGGVLGGFVSGVIYTIFDTIHFSSGSILRMITFGLFGILIGLSIYFVSFLFTKLKKN